MFGIGFAISIPLIVIALLLDDFGGLVREVRRRMARRRAKRTEEVDFDGGNFGFEALKMEQMLSVARSHKKSVDEWAGGRVSRETARTGREKVTGFRMRMSGDVERGQ
jgi:hypothetical protein